MKVLNQYEVWFVTGSQHLYGDEILQHVATHSAEIAKYLDAHDSIPVSIKFKIVVKSPDEVLGIIKEANNADNCIGLVLWMHTFSPAKMWINGLKILNKPFVHLHTQYNAEILLSDIDMDFMNENQSAHGGREFGFMASRLRIRRKVIVGHWKEAAVTKKLGTWTRAAAGWHVLQHSKIARIGDNMREVAVTEGDKVEAQIRLGVAVNGYGVGDVVKHIDGISEAEVKKLLEEYAETYDIEGTVKFSKALADSAQIELGLRSFLNEGNFQGFTDTFENLHGMKQLPGIAAQRLMADGFGFAAEGDWKTAALLHAMKVMSKGLEGGTSFMEDYTYDFRNGKSRVLGSHMLEICPSIALDKPKCEIHSLSIGGKEDPARLVFNVASGPAINLSIMDMGNRFRLLLNEVEAVKPENELPKLPVARVLWEPKPNLDIAAQAWIHAGGSHHTVFSQSITSGFIEDFADMAGIELAIIDDKTEIRSFRDSLRWSEVYYHLFENNL